MSFPCEKSIGFPSRKGTLNFYDDKTHRNVPNWDRIMSVLSEKDFEVLFCCKQYRPPITYAIGLLLELVSRIKKKICIGTWAFWGFESIIWARKMDLTRE